MNVSPEEVYADIHLHSTFKPFMIKDARNPWVDYNKATPEEQKGRTARFSQSDFSKSFAGNMRILGMALHAVERSLMNQLVSKPGIIARILGLDIAKMREIYASRPFDILQQELAFFYQYLKEPGGSREAVVAKNYAHLQQILANPDQIGILLCIEGAHNLGFEYRDELFPALNKKIAPAEPLNEALVDERIGFMKQHNVFMLTLCHFVFNHLATQPKAVELTGAKKIITKNPIHSLKQVGDYRGLTFLGSYMVESLFENNIQIDIKHCDAMSRKHIYQIARKMNKTVIGSHVACSGRPTNIQNNHLLNPMEDSEKERLASMKFNMWDINLHDDDLIAIHELGGLMGLIMDERVLAGEKLLKEIRRTNGNWYSVVYNHIEHIYQVLRKAGFPASGCFDSICIGSDFDGMIDPIDTVTNEADMPRLARELESLIEANYKQFEASDLSPQQIVQKIMGKNVQAFLSKHFR